MYSSGADKYFLWLYIKNLVVIRYRGAYLGLIWNILQPLFYLLILGYVFATFNNAPLKEYVLYLFAGLVPWRFFEQSALSMVDSIIINSVITKRIRMPYIYFPLAQLGIAFVDFLSAFGVLLILFLAFQATWHIHMLILPLSIAVWILIAAGSGIILSVVFVFFQDIKPIVQMILMLILFTSTIFFKIDLFYHDSFKFKILKLDPVCYWVSLFQKPIYYGQWPGTLDWAVSLTSGILLFMTGLFLYGKLKHKFYYYM
ncbi:MAG: ABC transporter permease [Proteobacteria bacterium]|nr:ABC transporter permease [Pseudomonadota bacterium]